MNSWDLSPALPVPLDVFLDIVAHLPLQSVLTLRQTCKSFHAVTRLRSLWALLFRMHVVDKHIPYPDLGSRTLADLSAKELESLTHRALALRRSWTSPEPLLRRHITFNTAKSDSRIIFLQFLPGRSNRWLISVRMAMRPRSYLLQCWDVASRHPRCVAELRHVDGPFGGVVLNSDPFNSAVLAMQSAQTETFSIDFGAEDPECAFETEATIDGIRELHLLSGSTLVTRCTDDSGALCLWDLGDLDREKVRLLNPSIRQPEDRVQAVHLAHDYALVVRALSVEIYSTTPRPNLIPIRGAPIAYPLAQFKFQWHTDAVVLCEQRSHQSHPSSSLSPEPPEARAHAHLSPRPRPRPVHMFVRFGSMHPWPVNVLHHYILFPNPAFHRRAWVTTEYNLPYDPRPYPARVMGSPVRLFGQSAMALGRYGTALWLDNHTKECLGPSEQGQRLAGRMVWVSPGGNAEGKKKCDGWQMGASARTGGGPMNTRKPMLCAESNVVAESGGAEMVFCAHDDDTWTRIAMEEEAGRIAVGHANGTITLMEC